MPLIAVTVGIVEVSGSQTFWFQGSFIILKIIEASKELLFEWIIFLSVDL